jgi:hypothetical protein
MDVLNSYSSFCTLCSRGLTLFLIESMTLDAMAYCEDRARCGQEKRAQKQLPSSSIQIRRELIKDLAQIKLVVREHIPL